MYFNVNFLLVVNTFIGGQLNAYTGNTLSEFIWLQPLVKLDINQYYEVVYAGEGRIYCNINVLLRTAKLTSSPWKGVNTKGAGGVKGAEYSDRK